MNHNLEIVYSEIECENSRHKMKLQKLEYLKLKEEVEHRKNLGELIEKKYSVLYNMIKNNRCYKYQPYNINL